MGVPKQVAEMEAEGDRELDAKVEQVAIAPLEHPQQEHKPETSTETVVADRSEGVLSNIAKERQDAEEIAQKERQREASAQGRLSKLQGDLRAQRESYEAKIAELENSIAGLTKKLEDVRIGGASDKADDETDDELFAEIRKEYSEDDYSNDDLKRFIGVIKRVGNRNQRALDKIQQRFDEMDAERAERAKSAAKAEADGFVSKLNEEFPGFREIDANNDPRWTGFLASSLGGVMEGTTYQDIATEALKKLDYRKFSSVVREFAKQNGIAFSPNGNPVDASVASQVRPNGVAAVDREQGKKSPQRIPMAEIEEFRKAAFAHRAEERYGMTREQVLERLRLYEDAEAEGRVI